MLAGKLKRPFVRSLLVEPEGDRQHLFVFPVESTRSGIDVVQWTPEFTDFMKLNMGPAKPLFDALMTFHHTQNLSLWADQA